MYNSKEAPILASITLLTNCCLQRAVYQNPLIAKTSGTTRRIEGCLPQKCCSPLRGQFTSLAFALHTNRVLGAGDRIFRLSAALIMIKIHSCLKRTFDAEQVMRGRVHQVRQVHWLFKTSLQLAQLS